MKYYIYADGEEVKIVNAKGYVSAKQKGVKAGFIDCVVYREDDVMPPIKKKKKKKQEVIIEQEIMPENEIINEGEENDIHE